MKTNCYCLHDRKSLAYHPPFFAVNDAVAVRTLSDVVADVNTNIGRHPNDYVLFCVGVFDDSNAALLPMSPIRHVVDAIVLVKALQSEIPFPEQATDGTAWPRSTKEEAA